MKIRMVVALALLLPLVAGCLETIDEGVMQSAREGMKPNVSGFDQVRFQTVSYPSTTPMRVSSSDPVFDFGGGNASYFKALELPVSSTPYAMRIMSPRFDWDYPGSHHTGYFIPTIMLLDADRKPLPGPVTIHGPVYRSIDFRHVWTEIKPDMGARYALIYTTQAALTGGEEVKDGWSVASVGVIFIPVPGPTYDFDAAPIGPIEVTLAARGEP